MSLHLQKDVFSSLTKKMSSHHELHSLYCEEQQESYVDSPSPNLLEWEEDDEELTSLLHKEQENELQINLESNPSLSEARAEAVDWMLNVVAYYSFSPLTAVLAVNYLDRFFHSFKPPGEKKPWMTQLAAVACISLAAKVEETRVPLLLDLQVEESKYVFESKTIQRMEILVLSTLKWKMYPVTPLSFLDYIARKIGFLRHISREFLRRCHCLLLSLLSDCRFMSYLPSALATAVMLYVISSLEPNIVLNHQEQLIGILGIKKEKVEKCCRLIEEVGTRAAFFYSCNKRKLPGSPKGVVDVCFSPDDSAAVSASSSPELLHKKIKPK